MKRSVAGGSVWLLGLAACVHLASASWHVRHGGLNADEGFYAVSARAASQAELPYRDFGYTQMPLLPFVNGALMRLTGFGLLEQRAVNGLWAGLTLLLAVVWLARRTSPAWAACFALLLSLSAPWMYFTHLGKTYAFTGLAAIAAVWVATEWRPRARQVVVLALLGTLGVGCRLPSAPFFAVLWLAAWSGLPLERRSWLAAAAGSLLWPAALLLPFYLAAPEAARFWVVDFHLASSAAKPWRLTANDIAALAPALWLAVAAGLVFAIKPSLRPARGEASVLVATLLALAVSLLPHGVFEEYGTPFLPPLALVAACGLWRLGRLWPRLRHGALPLCLLPLNLAASVALLAPARPAEHADDVSMLLPQTAPAYRDDLPDSLARAERAVREHLPPDQPLIGPEIILAAETGHAVPRPLRMGAFSVTAEFSPEQARRLNLLTFEELDRLLGPGGTPMLAMSQRANLNYTWSLPSFGSAPEPDATRRAAALERDFAPVHEDADFRILARRSAEPPAP